VELSSSVAVGGKRRYVGDVIDNQSRGTTCLRIWEYLDEREDASDSLRVRKAPIDLAIFVHEAVARHGQLQSEQDISNNPSKVCDSHLTARSAVHSTCNLLALYTSQRLSCINTFILRC
jgi:hypothetical protein